MGQSKSTKIIIKTKYTLLHPLLLFIFQIRIYVGNIKIKLKEMGINFDLLSFQTKIKI